VCDLRRSSFDSGAHGEAVSASAQDDSMGVVRAEGPGLKPPLVCAPVTGA